MNPAEPFVEAVGLTKIYQQGSVEVPALRGVELRCRRGEFIALVGPSGSGKSTLLNLIGTLDTPTAGRVRIAGRETAVLGRRARALFRLEHIGFIFQAYNLLPTLSAYENAEYTLLLRGVARGERRARVVPLLERVGLGGMMERRPQDLSGGQQQRVAVVRAVAARPSLVLADEPTANLDSASAASLLSLMEELNRDEGLTFLLASHDPLVRERAQRVVRLRDGLLESDEARRSRGRRRR